MDFAFCLALDLVYVAETLLPQGGVDKSYGNHFVLTLGVWDPRGYTVAQAL